MHVFAMDWWVEIPTCAHGGCLWLFAFGLRSLFVVVVFLSCFVLSAWEEHIWPGDVHFFFTPCGLFVSLPSLFVCFCTGYRIWTCLCLSFCLFSVRTAPVSVIGRTRRRKRIWKIFQAQILPFGAVESVHSFLSVVSSCLFWYLSSMTTVRGRLLPTWCWFVWRWCARAAEEGAWVGLKPDLQGGTGFNLLRI